jgi:prepilin-type N-terminal cleavage/methylation domain-containing protein
MSSPRSAFTLFELLVVVAVLTAIAGTAVVGYGNLEAEQRVHISASEQQALAQAVAAFYRDTGRAPAGFEQLVEQPDPTEIPPYRVGSRSGWRGPYIDWRGADPSTEFQLNSDGNHLAILHSHGLLPALETQVPSP